MDGFHLRLAAQHALQMALCHLHQTYQLGRAATSCSSCACSSAQPGMLLRLHTRHSCCAQWPWGCPAAQLVLVGSSLQERLFKASPARPWTLALAASQGRPALAPRWRHRAQLPAQLALSDSTRHLACQPVLFSCCMRALTSAATCAAGSALRLRTTGLSNLH